jgi:hypothetical protein
MIMKGCLHNISGYSPTSAFTSVAKENQPLDASCGISLCFSTYYLKLGFSRPSVLEFFLRTTPFEVHILLRDLPKFLEETMCKPSRP